MEKETSGPEYCTLGFKDILSAFRRKWCMQSELSGLRAITVAINKERIRMQ